MNRTRHDLDVLVAQLKSDKPGTFAERLATSITVMPEPKRSGRRGPVRQRATQVARSAGVSPDHLRRLLLERHTPSIFTVAILAHVVGVSPGWLAYGIPPVRLADKRLDQVNTKGIGPRAAASIERYGKD